MSKNIPAEQIDQVIDEYKRMMAESLQCPWLRDSDADQWLSEKLAALRRVRDPRHRSEAFEAVQTVAVFALQEMRTYLLPDLRHCEKRLSARRERISELEAQIAAPEGDNKRLRRRIYQSAPSTVTIPKETVTLRSQIQRAILHLMASEGLGHSWRIQQRIIDLGMTQNKNSVRNALRKLGKKDLIRDYTWKGRVVGWTPIPGGERRLVTLTEEKGHPWCREALGKDVVASELDAMARQHNSVTHAVGILEARDHLRARGYPVDDSPEPILREEDHRWGKRVEPDLIVVIDELQPGGMDLLGRWTVSADRVLVF